MKTARFAIALALLSLSFTEVPSHAQNRRRRRSRPSPPAATSSKVEMTDADTTEERARIAEECAIPGRPMPAVEVGMRGNALPCGKAISLPKPAYPPEAKAEKASGVVPVKVVVDQKGRVVWAEAAEGHPLLRGPAVKAACRAWFSPVKISGRGVRAGGVINYNFQL
jgi:TonB family protein